MASLNRGRHDHCDHDPIECSVEALRGEYAEVKRQRDTLLLLLADYMRRH